MSAAFLIDRIDAALPQTQCTRCGYADCRAYAQAIAAGDAAINQCPPGGAEGIARLAAITGRDVIALNPANGSEGPRRVMFIDEARCIGCTLCIKACPVDCIVGAPKLMHTIIEDLCTGCELCLPACPVDCILVENASPGPNPKTGWDAWSEPDAERARLRYQAHRERSAAPESAAQHDEPVAPERKRTAVEAALRRAREQRGATR